MTDFDLQQQLIEARRRQYGQQAQFQSPQGQMVGRHYVAPNVLQQLAAGLRSFGGMQGQAMAEQELKDLNKKRQDLQTSEMQALTQALRGTPENAPPEGQQGPVRPAQPGSIDAFYGRAMASPLPNLQQVGMQGQISMAQEQAKRQQQQAEQQRIMGILQQAKTPQEALAAGVPAELVKTYYDEGLGKPKLGGTREISGLNGEKLIQQVDTLGRPMGDPMPAYMAPVQVNQGDKISFVVPGAGTTLPVGMSPAQRDASARGWATVNQGNQRLDIDRQKASQDKTDKQKALTEAQGKATMYLGQMRSASAELDKLGEKTSPVMVAATGSPWTNWVAGSNSQKAGQAQRQWAEAFLRAKTGAAATAGEVENNIRTFFPVVGDSPAVIQQKKLMRAQAESDMEIPSGPGVNQLNNRTPLPALNQNTSGFKILSVE